MMPIPLFKRFVAFSYDSLIVIALLIATTALSMLFNANTPIFPEDGLKFHLLQLSLLLVIIGYFALFWAYSGQTVGMKTWRIRLVDTSTHQAPRLSIALLRVLVAIFSLSLLGVGLLPALWRKDKATLYDILTHTRLIKSGVK